MKNCFKDWSQSRFSRVELIETKLTKEYNGANNGIQTHTVCWKCKDFLSFYLKFVVYVIQVHISLPHQSNLLIAFANSLDPDQARQNAGPDQDTNCLTLWWYFWKKFSKKLIWKKKITHKKVKHYASCKELTLSVPRYYTINKILSKKYCRINEKREKIDSWCTFLISFTWTVHYACLLYNL